MGLAWQQGPLGAQPAGRFLVEHQLPARLLYAEPAGRRMRVELAGAVVAASDQVTLLHETGRYPVAYFPLRDIDQAQLRASITSTRHPELGETAWWSLEIDGRLFEDVAWSHPHPPAHGAAMTGLIAFVWQAMDAFYEEDEPILGHAADPYHRVDIRASHRTLTVHVNDAVIAETVNPLAVFETGFAPRWYVPPRDVAGGALEEDPLRTFCPYKGVAHVFDVLGGGERVRAGAWSYPEALPESARLSGYVAFDPDLVEVSLDGEPLVAAPHQDVVATGTDRDLAADSN